MRGLTPAEIAEKAGAQAFAGTITYQLSRKYALDPDEINPQAIDEDIARDCSQNLCRYAAISAAHNLIRQYENRIQKLFLCEASGEATSREDYRPTWNFHNVCVALIDNKWIALSPTMVPNVERVPMAPIVANSLEELLSQLRTIYRGKWPEITDITSRKIPKPKYANGYIIGIESIACSPEKSIHIERANPVIVSKDISVKLQNLFNKN